MFKFYFLFIASAVTSLTGLGQSCKVEYTNLSLGREHTLGLKSNGTIWSWGHNAEGQLGRGTNSVKEPRPQQVGTDENWQSISAGGYHSLAIKKDGTLWGWGENYFHQLGVETGIDYYNKPIQIGTETNWKIVEGGYLYSIAIKKDGTLWVWGDNVNLDGYSSVVKTPKQIGLLNQGETWESVAGGHYHSLALKSDGTIWAWGQNTGGELGQGNTGYTFGLVRVGTDHDWKSIEAFGPFSLAIKENGSLWAWGNNHEGQLGIANNINQYKPVQVGTASDWQMVKAGSFHAIGLKQNGTVWVWGANDAGQLGTNNNDSRNTPIQLNDLTEINSVFAGGEFSAIFSLSLDKICFTGKNKYGQFGTSTTDTSKVFVCGKLSGIVERWIGTVDNSWHNPLNWACNLVPDINTDVVIKPGTPFSCSIENPAVCASLTIYPGATLTAKDNLVIGTQF